MMSSRNFLSLLGALLVSKVAAQNASCSAMAPKNFTEPTYSFTQPFLPYLAPEGTRSFDDADTSGAIVYHGAWVAGSDPSAVDKTLHTTTDPSAFVTFTFTGTGVEWFGVIAPGSGFATVREHGMRDGYC